MAMIRGTPLVATIARVVQLTGQQNLTNLQTGSDPTVVTDLLVTASDTIFDRLEGDGIDPTQLTNETAFERAVAWEMLSSLYANAYLVTENETATEAFDRGQAQVDRHYGMVRPKTTDANDPRRANESRPRLANFDRGWVFAGDNDPRLDEYTTARPRRRNT